jgi:hypothetical protein
MSGTRLSKQELNTSGRSRRLDDLATEQNGYRGGTILHEPAARGAQVSSYCVEANALRKVPVRRRGTGAEKADPTGPDCRHRTSQRLPKIA